jgi:hypothetical protein
MISEQVVPSAVARRVIIKFPTNKNVKAAEIMMRLRAKFRDETPSRAEAYDWNKSFKDGRTEGENTPRPRLLQGKLWPEFFWDPQSVLFIGFLTEQRTIDAAYYSKLLKDRVSPTIRSKRRGRSVKSVCLHDNARPHTAAVTTGTLDETHWEVLPHSAYSPELAPSDFHLFGPLKKEEKYLELTMKLSFLCNDGWKSIHKLFLKGA